MASSTSMSSEGGDLQVIIDERKRKRKLSNRESARRSRMKRQKQMEEMMTQIDLLRKENEHIVSRVNLTTEIYLNVESENSVLRAQMSELDNRLNSLNEIASFLYVNNGDQYFHNHQQQQQQQIQICEDDVSFFMNNNNPWNNNSFPLMAEVDMVMY
jgi:ABC-type phosphate transport system auxiliary subunit